jgi:hypothetical protein
MPNRIRRLICLDGYLRKWIFIGRKILNFIFLNLELEAGLVPADGVKTAKNKNYKTMCVYTGVYSSVILQCRWLFE